MICRYGTPEVLIIDQVRDSLNQVSAELYAIAERTWITSAYHPGTTILCQSLVCGCMQLFGNLIMNSYLVMYLRASLCYFQCNRLTERFNQALSRCLSKTIDGDELNRDEKLDSVLIGYRASPQTCTKQSPHTCFSQLQIEMPPQSPIVNEGRH